MKLSHRQRSLSVAATVAARAAIPSCDNTPEPAAMVETYAIDCVAILGTPGKMPPTPPIPLDSIPYYEAPRGKRFDELTDAELGKFCDHEWCLRRNGYRHVDEVDGPNSAGPYGRFRIETTPLLAARVKTCFVTPGGTSDPSPHSRESCMYILRHSLRDCTVGASEDYNREQASGLYRPFHGPRCEALNCGVGRAPTRDTR